MHKLLNNIFLVISVFTFIFLGCAGKQNLTGRLIEKDSERILYGEISETLLFKYYPEWGKIFDTFEPETAILRNIPQQKLDDLNIIIFLGTWCPDSKQIVPRFLKLVNALKVKSIRLFAVDRTKTEASGIATQYEIERVATIIFKNSNGEIGRITEFPVKTLEEDMLNILLNSRDENEI